MEIGCASIQFEGRIHVNLFVVTMVTSFTIGKCTSAKEPLVCIKMDVFKVFDSMSMKMVMRGVDQAENVDEGTKLALFQNMVEEQMRFEMQAAQATGVIRKQGSPQGCFAFGMRNQRSFDKGFAPL